MKKIVRSILVLLYAIFSFSVATSQSEAPVTNDRDIENKNFDRLVTSLLDFSIPIISVQELYSNYDNYTILDSREAKEYEVSHLKGAISIGYDNWNPDVVKHISKDEPIVIYCSIGYRSEKIGEKLKEMGFTNVKNLYGSIFEWVNQSYPIVDATGEETKKIHGFSWLWGKWVKNDEYKVEF